MSDLIKAIGYIRVSSAEQASHGESLSTQRKDIQRYCKYKGYSLIDVIEDAGISGAKEIRPGLDSIMEQAKLGAIKILVITKFSRLARNTRHLLNTYHSLKSLGIALHSIAENFSGGDSPHSVFQMETLAAVAQLEREIIKEQMQSNKMVRWMRKDIYVGRPPYGYAWDKVHRKLIIHKEQAEIYHRIIHEYLILGRSLRDIQIALDADGVLCDKHAPPKKDGTPVHPKSFSTASLGYLLRNPVYYGECLVNRYKYIDGKRSKQEKPPGQAIRFDIEPLIDRKTWDQIQAKMQSNKTRSKNCGDDRGEFFLRNILVCNECGAKIKPHRGSLRKTDGKGIRHYGCYWSISGAKTLQAGKHKRCYLPMIDANWIESVVWNKVLLQLIFWKNKNKLKALLSESRFDRELKQLGIKIKATREKLRKRMIVRRNLSRILEHSDMSGVDLSVFIKDVQAADMSINNLKKDLTVFKVKYNLVLKNKEKRSDFSNFLRNQEMALRNIEKQLIELPPGKKQILLEAMADSPIRVGGDRREDPTAFICSNYPATISLDALRSVLDIPSISGSNSQDGSDHLYDLNPENIFAVITPQGSCPPGGFFISGGEGGEESEPTNPNQEEGR